MRPVLPALLGPLLLANIRAPYHLPRAPSHALSPAGPALTVDAEHLHIDCKPTSCSVSAIYDITASEAGPFGFRFIGPAEGGVNAKVAGADAAVTVRAFKQEDDLDGRYTLYEASFAAPVPRGATTIAVSYDQPLGLYETRYGYFVPSAFAYEFSYELWPLMEWPRAPTFRADIAILWTERPSGLFGWLFGAPDVHCAGLEPLPGTSDGETRFTLRGELPRRLRCLIDAPASAKETMR